MNETSLTLYDILVEPLRLMEILEEIQENDDEDYEDGVRAELIAETEQAIDKLIELQPTKIDNFCGFHRECEKRAEIDKEEGERLIARAKRWESRKKYLEVRAIQAMQAAGKERIDGQHNTLALRKNPPSVEIAQPELLPAEFLKLSVTLPVTTWSDIYEILHPHEEEATVLKDAMAVKCSEPMKADIAKQLKASDLCPKCGGKRLIESGQTTGPARLENCDQCGGSGRIPRGVPGARLVQNVRLEIK